MNKTQEKRMRELAGELAKEIKTPEDLREFSTDLKRIVVEAALGAEMEAHLGYAKHSSEGAGTGNSRNGLSSKTLKGDHGEVVIDTPRDRNSSFEPVLVKKGQTRMTGMDEQILCLSSEGIIDARDRRSV